MGGQPVPLWVFCRLLRGRSAERLVGGPPKYAPDEPDRLTRQMPVRDADVRCCIKCNERRPDNAQEERSYLAAPLLSCEFFSLVMPEYWRRAVIRRVRYSRSWRETARLKLSGCVATGRR
jgi:hypothetical protein